MQLYLHNTLSAAKEQFIPQDNERVTMYVCGPTVYNHPHIGNARPAVVFDTLFRLLQQLYPNVIYARNITDIDDKINKSAKELNVSIKEITDKYTDIYHADVKALACLSPTVEPRATAHIGKIVNMINVLVDNKNAYFAEGHVLFDVQSYKEYGALSKRDLKEMIAGARVEVAPYKKDPMDFVLWKPSTPDLPGWDSPWGRGRPGWHIECSAMIEAHLGNTIDIHGGGLDLTFPHHENEIAQGTCAHGGATYAKYWVHNGFINVNAEKMSKSIGNVLLVKDLLGDYAGEVIRLAILSTHYRKPLEWTDETPLQAKAVLDGWYRALELLGDIEAEAKPTTELLEALCDDLNTPKAIAEIHALAKAANTAKSNEEKASAKSALLGAGIVMGLFNQTVEEWFKMGSHINEQEIQLMIDSRNNARKSKDFALADKIRGDLLAKGIAIEDTAQGTIWRNA